MEYSINSKMGELLDNDQTRQVLEKHFPEVMTDRQINQSRTFSFKMVAGFLKVTKEKLKEVNKELNKIGTNRNINKEVAKQSESKTVPSAILVDKKIENRKKRWTDLVSMKSNTKKLLRIITGDDMDDEEEILPKVLAPGNEKQRIDYILEKYEKLLGRVQRFEDDTIPYLKLISGVEIFAEAFGCKVKYSESGMPFALPMVKTAADVTKLKVPDLFNSTLVKHFEVADEVIKKAGNNPVMGLTDTPCPFEAAAQIWDKNEFFIALIKEPEAIKELTAKIMQLQTAFFDEWFKCYGNEFIAPFPDVYMKGGLYISNDEVGSINEQMFLDYVLDDLNTLSERYGGLGMHCCANAQHQWGNFKKIKGLRILNLVQPKDVCIRAYKYFENNCAQVHMFDDNIEAMLAENTEKKMKALESENSFILEMNYPENAHVVIMPLVIDEDQAIEISEKFHLN